MVVGVCHILFIVHESNSLKAKRQVLKKLVDKIRNRFNVSVAEVGSNDLWQKGEIAISTVGTDGAVINSLLDKVLNFVEDLGIVEVIDHSIELI